METINIGLLLSTDSNYNQIKELLVEANGFTERFTVYHPNQAFTMMKQKPIDLLLVSDMALGNSCFREVASQVGKTKIVVVLEAHKEHPPVAFLMFSMVHILTSALMFSSVLRHAVLGGVAYCTHISNIIKSHGTTLISPSECGLTQRHIQVLNEYLVHLSHKVIAEHLEITASTAKSTMQTILSKLELTSISELITFLRVNHWCNLATGEVIWF